MSKLVAYSGFSATNYLEMPYNSDFDFGTGDFFVMGWVKMAANSAVETILERDSSTTAQRFTLAVDASGNLTFTCDDDTTARTVTSNRAIDNDVWTQFVALYDGAGDVKIYLNGVLNNTETGSALLTLNNASAVLRIGLAVDGAEPLTNGALALCRIAEFTPTADEIRRIYEAERDYFTEDAAYTIPTVDDYTIDVPQKFVQLDDGTIDNRITVERSAQNNLQVIGTTNGEEQTYTQVDQVSDNGAVKIALSWDSSGLSASLNGSSALTDSGFTNPPNATSLRIGSGIDGLQVSSYIKSVTYFPQKVKDILLQNTST